MLLSVQIISYPEKVFNLLQQHHVITVKHMMIVFKPQDALPGSSANNYLFISLDLKKKKKIGRGGVNQCCLVAEFCLFQLTIFRFDLKFRNCLEVGHLLLR